MNKRALIVFVKNPIVGKVKTRLAKDIGDAKAVEVYKKLLRHTRAIIEGVDADKYVFYGDYVNDDDIWNDDFTKVLQQGDDLGQRMLQAFKQLLEKGHEQVVIIGSDCYELNTTIINKAYSSLQETDTVIGPTLDGGYYLLGMKRLQDFLFKNIEWSTDTVYANTIDVIKQKKLSYTSLQQLSDVDYVKDVPENWL